MIKQQLAENVLIKMIKTKILLKESKNRQAQSPIDRNSLQASLDSSYHEYKMIDRDKANATEFNKVKATFDKVNELLGKEDNATSDELTLVYQELVQAIELARTLPQRSIDSNTLKRSTRGVNSDRAQEVASHTKMPTLNIMFLLMMMVQAIHLEHFTCFK